jgi:PII-like signaling protein
VDISGDALEVRVYMGESDRREGLALYDAVVRFLREKGCAGVTVLRGVEGFGAHSRIHSASLLRLSEDLPVVVIAVDRRDRIEPLLDELTRYVDGGLVTVTPTHVVHYGTPASSA